MDKQNIQTENGKFAALAFTVTDTIASYRLEVAAGKPSLANKSE